MDFLAKKYETIRSSKNFDEFMKALSVDQLSRIEYDPSLVSTEIRKEDDSHVLVVSYNSNSNEFKFEPGKIVEEDRADGVKVKSVYNSKINMLKQMQKCHDVPETILVKEFKPEKIKAVLKAKDFITTRIYEAQKTARRLS